jgi:hypothetical protein
MVGMGVLLQPLGAPLAGAPLNARQRFLAAEAEFHLFVTQSTLENRQLPMGDVVRIGVALGVVKRCAEQLNEVREEADSIIQEALRAFDDFSSFFVNLLKFLIKLKKNTNYNFIDSIDVILQPLRDPQRHLNFYVARKQAMPNGQFHTSGIFL